MKIISDYIALEQLRYDDSLRVNFNYDVEDMKQSLPPLLLISLVENAFKHGVSETRNQPFVDIHLAVNKRQLAFIVKNSMETFSEERQVKENIDLMFLDIHLPKLKGMAFLKTLSHPPSVIITTAYHQYAVIRCLRHLILSLSQTWQLQ